MHIDPTVAYISDRDIEVHATTLLAQYSRELEQIVTPPVPVEQIADFLLKLNIDWSPIPDDNASPILGCIIPATRTIQINERRREHFERYFGTFEYTLGHELGHHELHLLPENLEQLPLIGNSSQPGHICRPQQVKDRRELQAERFASYLLMPSFLLLPSIEGKDLCNWQTLYRLRDQFHVSITALNKRLTGINRLYVDEKGKLHPSKMIADGQRRLF